MRVPSFINCIVKLLINPAAKTCPARVSTVYQDDTGSKAPTYDNCELTKRSRPRFAPAFPQAPPVEPQ